MASDGLTVTRKVHFFRITHSSEFMDLLPQCLGNIETLPWEGQGRYLSDASDNTVLSVLSHTYLYPLRLEFGRTRRDNLPAIERKGVKRTLSIAEDAGLIDVSHVVIFADGFVAAEFNRDGPRISKLGEYMMFKGRNLPSAPRFQRLLQTDLLGSISDLQDVKFLELEIPPKTTELIRSADLSLYDALVAQAKTNESERIGLYFHARNPRDGRLKRLASALAKLVANNPDSGEDFRTLKIKGSELETGKTRSFNLLEHYLVAEIEFKRSSKKARSIDSAAAFAAIEEAYAQRREMLPTAIRGNDPWAQ